MYSQAELVSHKGLFGKGVQMYYKHINNPDRYIKKIFEELNSGKLPNIKWYGGLVSKATPLKSSPLQQTIKTAPLPKAKGKAGNQIVPFPTPLKHIKKLP